MWGLVPNVLKGETWGPVQPCLVVDDREQDKYLCVSTNVGRGQTDE